MTTVTKEFLEFSREKLLDEYWPRMRVCVETLTDEQVWWRPNDASNSIGNLLMHLNGNMRQWIIASFGGTADQRDRPAEFAARNGASRGELLERLGATVDEAAATIARLTDADLTRLISIQGYNVTGLHAVYHAVEHFGMHHGQVIYITKLVTGQGMGFYQELDATGRFNDGQVG